MTREERADWYADLDSACPTCGHGPRWHNDPSGCTRMNAGWCPCERVYATGTAGPDDYTGQDGSYYAAPEHWNKGNGTCGYCGGQWSAIAGSCLNDMNHAEDDE